jgi:prolyl-tRNA synthetase
MKITGLVGRTLRAQPSGVSAAMGLAVRAGFLRPCAGGWTVLPLGVRILDRMSDVLLKGLECQSVGIPVRGVEEAGRVLSELMLGGTQSYRHLPLRIATSWRGAEALLTPSTQAEPHPLLGIAGAFMDEGGLTDFLGHGFGNLRGLSAWAGLDVDPAGSVGGSSALVAFGRIGRSATLNCAACGAIHLREATPFLRRQIAQGPGGALELVRTPGASTIQALAAMLGVEREQTLKALFLCGDAGDLIFALVRGDLDVSMEKLARVARAGRLRPATDSEIVAAGAFPGFASPIGMRVRGAGEREGVKVVADLSVFSGVDFAVGANAPDYHYVHVDPHRDFSVTEVADIALAPAGACCAVCGALLTERRGTIVAHSSPLDAPLFSDGTGVEKHAAAAWTVVDLLVLFEQVVSACADDDGIAWPASLAPADVHMVSLKESDACGDAVKALEHEGLTVLFDDRPISAGAKFADADLIGCPLRVTISSRSLLAGGGELAGRKGDCPVVVPLDALPQQARTRLAALMSS